MATPHGAGLRERERTSQQWWLMALSLWDAFSSQWVCVCGLASMRGSMWWAIWCEDPHHLMSLIFMHKFGKQVWLGIKGKDMLNLIYHVKIKENRRGSLSFLKSVHHLDKESLVEKWQQSLLLFPWCLDVQRMQSRAEFPSVEESPHAATWFLSFSHNHTQTPTCTVPITGQVLRLTDAFLIN